MLKSLDRGLSIAKYLAVKKSASITEIAEKFNIDKSTASRILAVLKKQDIVYKNNQNMKYSLSIGALLFSFRLMSAHAIINVAQSVLQDLTAQTHETAHLCSLYNDQIYLLSLLKSPQNKYMPDSCLPGQVEPFHCSAVGKVILANMLPSDARLLLERSELTGYTENTIVNIEELMEQFAVIRRNGYALDEGEYAKGICCVAVPVYNEYGDPTFSLGITGYQRNITSKDLFEDKLLKLRSAARKLTKEYVTYIHSERESSVNGTD